MHTKHFAAKRYLAIDLLRGLTIAFMILVNDPVDDSATFRPLKQTDTSSPHHTFSNRPAIRKV